MRRSHVEAEGFRVQRAETLRGTRLESIENVLDKSWWIKPVFEYEGAEFNYGEQRDRVTTLDVPDDEAGEITVHLICRDENTERERINYLTKTLRTSNKKFLLIR